MSASSLLWAVAAVVGVPVVLCGHVFLVERLVARAPPRRRGAIRPWLWLLPAFLPLLAFLVYPVLHTLVLSFMDANAEHGVGLANYRYIFGSRSMLIVLRNNALWLVVFTAATVALGLLVAVLTDRVRYEAAVKAAVFVPMAISFVAAGVIWKFMFQYQPPGEPQVGTLNAALTALVPGSEPQGWLIDKTENNWALIAVGVWMWTGFAMVILSAALKGIDEALFEAARLEGASELQIFRRVILPLLRPTVIVVATTLVISVLKVFDIVYVMTNGNLDTDVIANRMYKELFNYHHLGRASAFAVLLLLAILPVIVINIRRFGQKEAAR